MRPGDPKAIEEMFNALALNYNFLNDLLSLGLHRLWKRKLLTFVRPLKGESWIDMCCGTGDMSFFLDKLVGEDGKVYGIDYASTTLLIARERAAYKKAFSIKWLKENVLETSLSSHEFDGVIMAYGLRNLSDPKSGLEEVFRLLKPGGRAGFLDFNKSKKGSIPDIFQKFYLRYLVVPIASILRLGDHYAYLEKSLKMFPSGRMQKQLALEVGFKEASYKTIAMEQMGVLLLKA